MTLPDNVVSLVLASMTGWELVAYGSLPVAILRERGRSVLLTSAGWLVVMALAPMAVFHWYLIFTLFGLVAWTKLDRPAGKIWLALSGALGLTLGVIFPLEITPALMTRENPFLLALLYLGGATTGFAYVAWASSLRPSADNFRPLALVRGTLVFASGWLAVLTGRARRSPLTLSPPSPQQLVVLLAPDLVAAVVIILAAFTLVSMRRGTAAQVRLWSGATAAVSFAGLLLGQLVFR